MEENYCLNKCEIKSLIQRILHELTRQNTYNRVINV